LVFVPLLLLDGLEGRLLRPLAVAYLSAIFASLLVAVTVTPVLCLMLLPKGIDSTKTQDPPLLRWLLRIYEPLLARCVRRPGPVFGGAIIMVLIGVAALTGLGRAFLPEFNEGSVTINMVLAPGTALSESNALATMAERALLEDPGVQTVGRRTGRAERDEHVLGVETSELEVRIEPDDTRTREQLFADLRERLQVVPAQFTLGQPISHRIEHMVSGQRSALSIKVIGDDLRVLRRVAEDVRATAADVHGLVDVGVEQIVDIPQLILRMDAARAANYGFSPGQAARAISTALWGVATGVVYEEGTATEIVLRYEDLPIEDLDEAVRTRIPTPTGALVPLSALAHVEVGAGPNYVLRENGERRISVTANVEGGDVRGAYEAARKAIEDRVDVPAGTRIDYAGQFAREEAASRRLWILGFITILGIALIVGTTLGSLRKTLIVLVNLPLALAGGVAGVYLAGGVLSIATTIGFITLFGIASRNGILLATRTKDLEAEGLLPPAAALLAAKERLAPILMTALTAALGLLPLALSLGKPGSEIQAPMALVILTGLVTSTALNMLVVPVLLARTPPRKQLSPS
ncbi:MAG: efflux RND transporter permease subunit, partial [Myxococcales bacterium]|nr:efflux RND transporter permease subunit [Myxococcales bacterium]